MKETIKENRKSSYYVVMDMYEEQQISPEFDTLKEVRQFLKKITTEIPYGKYILCIVKKYTYWNEKGKLNCYEINSSIYCLGNLGNQGQNHLKNKHYLNFIMKKRRRMQNERKLIDY